MQNPRHHKISYVSNVFFKTIYKCKYIYEQIIHLSVVFEIPVYLFAVTFNVFTLAKNIFHIICMNKFYIKIK